MESDLPLNNKRNREEPVAKASYEKDQSGGAKRRSTSGEASMASVNRNGSLREYLVEESRAEADAFAALAKLSPRAQIKTDRLKGALSIPCKQKSHATSLTSTHDAHPSFNASLTLDDLDAKPEASKQTSNCSDRLNESMRQLTKTSSQTKKSINRSFSKFQGAPCSAPYFWPILDVSAKATLHSAGAVQSTTADPVSDALQRKRNGSRKEAQEKKLESCDKERYVVFPLKRSLSTRLDRTDSELSMASTERLQQSLSDICIGTDADSQKIARSKRDSRKGRRFHLFKTGSQRTMREAPVSGTSKHTLFEEGAKDMPARDTLKIQQRKEKKTSKHHPSQTPGLRATYISSESVLTSVLGSRCTLPSRPTANFEWKSLAENTQSARPLFSKTQSLKMSDIISFSQQRPQRLTPHGRVVLTQPSLHRSPRDDPESSPFARLKTSLARQQHGSGNCSERSLPSALEPTESVTDKIVKSTSQLLDVSANVMLKRSMHKKCASRCSGDSQRGILQTQPIHNAVESMSSKSCSTKTRAPTKLEGLLVTLNRSTSQGVAHLSKNNVPVSNTSPPRTIRCMKNAHRAASSLSGTKSNSTLSPLSRSATCPASLLSRKSAIRLELVGNWTDVKRKRKGHQNVKVATEDGPRKVRRVASSSQALDQQHKEKPTVSSSHRSLKSQEEKHSERVSAGATFSLSDQQLFVTRSRIWRAVG